MRWFSGLIHGLLYLPLINASPSFSSDRKRELRELIRQTWYHGYNSYMRVAFPMDELRPLSCAGLGPDRNDPSNYAVNDVNGNFSLTLIDVLDTFVVLGDKSGFEAAIKSVIDQVSFDQDVRIQVFEVTIRVLGGLLSAHLFATSPQYGFKLDWYKGELLLLGRDLADRLLPAFKDSPTGIPWNRINLRHGVHEHERTETCAAAAGSLLLEFATLSRLLNEPIYEDLARKAFYAVWNRRTHLDLLGNTIDMKSGFWNYGVASIGAGIDSIFEYMFKSYVMLGEDEYLRAWTRAYGAVTRHLRSAEGLWYRGVNVLSGVTVHQNVDSLSAFMPGLQVLAGDVEAAVRSHQLFANIWLRHQGIPEIFAVPQRQATSLAYPIRPELVESTLFLYQATGDDTYLSFAEQMILDIVNRTRVDCGLASVENLETGNLEDRMHSFALSETLKYAFLIFDEDNVFNHDISNTVFTTEGHLLPLPHGLIKPDMKRDTHSQQKKRRELVCSRYIPDVRKHWSPLALSVVQRTDSDYARLLSGLEYDESWAIRTGLYSPYGFCDRPLHEEFLIELLFTDSKSVEDPRPSRKKVLVRDHEVLVRSVENLRFQLVKRHDPTQSADAAWYDVARIAHHQIQAGATVLISDDNLRQTIQKQQQDAQSAIPLRFETSEGYINVQGQLGNFGPSVYGPQAAIGPLKPALNVIYSPHKFGCQPFSLAETLTDSITLMHRGECTFAQKSMNSGKAGAKGCIVVNTSDEMFVPSDDLPPQDGTEPYVPLIMLSNTSGTAVEAMLAKSKVQMTALEKPRAFEKTDKLVINGFVVRNARFVDVS